VPWQGWERVGRKSREKRERGAGSAKAKKKKSEVLGLPTSGDGIWERLGSGDLRLVEAHVENYLKGIQEAETALRILGRDAAAIVSDIAERMDDEKLRDLAKQLVAVKPKITTNMMELRAESVAEHVERAKQEATKLGSGAVTVAGPAFAVFDPVRIADALVKGGRPRTDIARIGSGDLLWVAVGDETASTPVVIAEGEGKTDALLLRLVVESGVVFVGPPEAADGPRMGTIRLHPMRTALDDHLGRGAFVAVPPGRYAARIYRDDRGVRVDLAPAPDERPLTLSMAMLSVPPST
jgi:hypothetical protein